MPSLMTEKATNKVARYSENGSISREGLCQNLEYSKIEEIAGMGREAHNCVIRASTVTGSSFNGKNFSTGIGYAR